MMMMNKINNKPAFVAVALVVGALSMKVTAPVNRYAFSPNGGATAELVKDIDATKKGDTLYGAIYNYTSVPIAAAFASAAGRGVDVSIICDKRASHSGNWKGKESERAGCHVYLDGHHTIFHDKYLIVNGKGVWTGSFNWTDNAEKHNGENLVYLDGTAAAKAFKTDWDKHKAEIDEEK